MVFELDKTFFLSLFLSVQFYRINNQKNKHNMENKPINPATNNVGKRGTSPVVI